MAFVILVFIFPIFYCSIDLSMTQSEDDLDVSTARTRNRRGGKRYSGEILDSHSVATGTIKRRKSVVS